MDATTRSAQAEAFEEWVNTWLSANQVSERDIGADGVPARMHVSGYLGESGDVFAHAEVFRITENAEGEQVYAGEDSDFAASVDSLLTIIGGACQTIDLSGVDYAFVITPPGA